MDKMKQYVVFAVLGCLFVLAAGWFLLVSPKRSEAADLNSQAAAQITQNLQLQNALSMLKSQAQGLPKQQARLAAVAAKIPDNPALPALVRALTTASAAAGIELVSVTPTAPTAVTGAATPAAAPVAGAKAAAPRRSVGQLSNIQLTLSVAGDYFSVEEFLANLEKLPRAMRVTGVTMAPGSNPLKAPAGGTAASTSGATAAVPASDGKTLTTTITGFVYMASNRPVAAPVVVPGKPTAPVAGPAAAAASAPSAAPTK
jgi:type IV pilus assembly protein PilO